MSFLSHLHTELRRTLLTRRGATHRPEDVPIGTHKEYPRMERIPLPETPLLDTSIGDVLRDRRSAHAIAAHPALSLDDWGALFGNALRKKTGSTNRMYPSGGALYPIETYVIGDVGTMPGSIFHYHPTANAFELLWEVPPQLSIKSLAPRPESLMFSALIVFTAVWERSSAKYGDLAYIHSLLEAGHMSGNLLLAATALGIAARPMAGFVDDALVQLLEIDEEKEQPVHSIVVGRAVSSGIEVTEE